MVATIAGIALCAWLLLDLHPALALMLGAILARTDPVLASAVTVGHSQDNDRLRCCVVGRSRLNEGAAFPFVVLGLLLLGPVLISEIVGWVGLRLLWAVPAGLTRVVGVRGYLASLRCPWTCG